MACGSCGGRKVASTLVDSFDPRSDAGRPKTNDRGMFLLEGDDYGCDPYHGYATGSTFFLVGLGTEYEQLFVRSQRAEAWQLAVREKLTFQHVSAVQLCHDRVVALVGG